MSKWVRGARPERIADIAAAFGGSDTAAYLLTTAYRESRGNRTMVDKDDQGQSRGLFGLTLTRAAARDPFVREWMLTGPIPVQVALAVKVIENARRHLGAETYGDVAASWKRPALVHRADIDPERSAVREKFARMAAAAGVKDVWDTTLPVGLWRGGWLGAALRAVA